MHHFGPIPAPGCPRGLIADEFLLNKTKSKSGLMLFGNQLSEEIGGCGFVRDVFVGSIVKLWLFSGTSAKQAMASAK